MAKKMKLDYDFENDILYMYGGEKAKDSIQIDDFVIDFSSDDKIVAIEILNASKILSKLSETIIKKEMLLKMKNAEMSIYQGKELVYITLSLHLLSSENCAIDLKIPLSAPAVVAASA